mmetsp:Transcript_15221/g.32505  ORF Transcript_15221/g.32505 Transcript_15221/m.32505 type:complete len:91 (-) Transcript_15221:974-1246(-)
MGVILPNRMRPRELRQDTSSAWLKADSPACVLNSVSGMNPTPPDPPWLSALCPVISDLSRAFAVDVSFPGCESDDRCGGLTMFEMENPLP